MPQDFNEIEGFNCFLKDETIYKETGKTSQLEIQRSVVFELPSEKRTTDFHGGELGNYHCDHCDSPMLPSEIAFQNQENFNDWFCSISCLVAKIKGENNGK